MSACRPHAHPVGGTRPRRSSARAAAGVRVGEPPPAPGQRFADAIGALPAHIGAEAHALADSLGAAERYGLPLGPVLDRLAAEAVDARRRHGEADARRLPVRLSFPLVATTLPSFVLIAIAPAVVGALSTLTVPTV